MKNLLKHIFCLVFISGISFEVYAQTIRITGKITASDNMEIAGVHIYDSIAKIGTSSNKDGIFSLIIPKKATRLRFSHVAFQTKHLSLTTKMLADTVAANTIWLDVVLTQKVKELPVVEISDAKVQIAYKNSKQWILDYEPVGTDEFLLLLIEKNKKYIELYLKENEIKFFEIAWFGGEPLLQFEKIIVDISRFAIHLCNKLKIQFMNSITTNGFLMNKEMVKQMKKLQFLSFQITIDGERNLHNKTRHDPALSSFDIIINNVVYLLETLTDTHLTLRYNYTPANLNIDLIVNQLNEIIPFELRERIDILPRKVWQIKDEKIDNRIILNMFKTIEENGYNIIDVDVKDSFMPCYVERKHFNTIFHSGAVDKCSNNPAEAKGYLNNDGKIIWNSENDFTLNRECMSCKFLPLCMGGCPNNKDYCNKNNSFKCQYSEKSNYNIIVNYCETILLKQNKLSYNKFDNGFVKKQ